MSPPTPSPPLLSAFSPGGAYLASTLPSLTTHRLRIHSSATSRLKCESTLPSGAHALSLSWGTLPCSTTTTSSSSSGNSTSASKKKRRRNDAVEEEEGEEVVGVALSDGSILLFSVSEGAAVRVLEGGHIGSVFQFVFSAPGAEGRGRGWSCGKDGKLVEWDLKRGITLRTITLPAASIRHILHAPPSVLCASHSVLSIAYENPGMSAPSSSSAHTSPIHTLLSSTPQSHFLTAADADRFINVFTLPTQTLTASLVASGDVRGVWVDAASDTLLAVTADGVEVFSAPFAAAAAAAGKRGGLTRRCDAAVSIVRPGPAKARVEVAAVCMQGADILMAWAESGVNIRFETLRCRNADGTLALNGAVTLTREKTIAITGGSGSSGNHDVTVSMDQSRTVVTSGISTEDIGMADAPGSGTDTSRSPSPSPPASPTFAEHLHSLTLAPHPPPTAATATTPAPPTTTSLTTILTQALKTTDTALLESILHTTDTTTILSTLRRLPSPLSVPLLTHLSTRLSRRPGRAASLGVWIRWTLVVHGGYLVSRPDLMRELAALWSTLHRRAGALERLLALQGRLDMVRAQVEMRAVLKGERGGDGGVGVGVGVVWAERDNGGGDEEEGDSSEEEGEGRALVEDASYINGALSARSVSGSEDEEEEEEETDSEDQADVDAFLDLEAVDTTDEEDGDDDEEEEEGEGVVDYDDVDGEGVDSDEEEDVVSAAPKKRAGKSKGGRVGGGVSLRM